ncbi:MAG: hypothetical protein IT378_16100, partial [Sandaracinaceae bacterium]|nr:hypothetical protein [Sandaracinaceae bacterium]
RAGLDGVEIALFVPPGSRPAPLEGAEGAIATEVEPGRDGTWIRFRRAHLPRTLAWTAAADVPAEALAQELRAARIAVPPPPRGAAERPRIDPSRAVLPVALLVLLLAWAKMAAMALAGRRGHAGPRPLVPLPVAARALLALAASAGAVVLARAGAGPALGLLAAASLLGAHRPHARVRPSRLGAWQPVDARFLRAARRARALEAVSPWSWLDATEPAGAVVLAASVALPWAAAHVGLTELSWPALAAASALPLPLLVTGTRRARPSSVARSLGLLLGAAAKLERLPPGVGLRPVVHVAADGRAQQARLRTTLAERPRGLLRLDLVVAHERHAGGLTPELALVVVTRASSPAERALAERLGAGASSPSGRRMLRMFAVGPEALEALERVAGALRDCPPAPAPDRGVAMDGETLRQLALPPAISI